MQLSTALMLSGLAMLSTSAATPNDLSARQQSVATFQTWTVPGCNEETGTERYQSIPANGACTPLRGGTSARSITVYFATNPTTCRVNTFSSAGCTGDVTSYSYTPGNFPCLPLSNKVSYNVTC